MTFVIWAELEALPCFDLHWLGLARAGAHYVLSIADPRLGEVLRRIAEVGLIHASSFGLGVTTLTRLEGKLIVGRDSRHGITGVNLLLRRAAHFELIRLLLAFLCSQRVLLVQRSRAWRVLSYGSCCWVRSQHDSDVVSVC